jgi:hypothetical protein
MKIHINEMLNWFSITVISIFKDEELNLNLSSNEEKTFILSNQRIINPQPKPLGSTKRLDNSNKNKHFSLLQRETDFSFMKSSSSF